jgi:hypothetical protein
MTGHNEFNYPAFNKAATELETAGYTVLNPATNTRPVDHPWDVFMRDAITQMLQADGVATLPGYIYSRGARLELAIARQLGITFAPHEQWLRHADVANTTTVARP